MTLGRNPAGDRVSVFLLRPLSQTLRPLYRRLLLSFLACGLVAVVLAGAGAGVVSRSLLGPFRNFVGFMESVAETGDFSRQFGAENATVEIRTLNTSYDRLITSLAQKHAQLVQRTRELSQANLTLTEEMREREQAQAALQASEEQLRQSQKLEAIGTLAGGVAHDFNNILTVIGSYTTLVLAELGPQSPLHEDLMQVRLAADRAAALTKQLLAFSRKQVMQPRVLELGAVVDGIEKMLRRVIGEDIDLRTVNATPPVRVKADPGQIEQVILNLAINARDAMPKGGTLAIETREVNLDEEDPARHAMTPPGRWVLLSVSDTGTGMEPSTQARIFEPFFTTKGPGKGTGLGLSMVYGIVKQSAGFIWVESELGRGTTFKVYLPPAEEESEEADWDFAAGGARGGSETVLLVEDEPPLRVLARRCLERAGYRVLEAGGAEEALTVSARHSGAIDLLLTDVVMPQVSGKELAERLSAIRPETRVLFMSGYTDDIVAQHGVLDPGTELLQKPFTPEGLTRRVREVLDRPVRAARSAPPTL
jgi:signal transduction histidine kinase/ActR/RegA family two-component response regulator